jgi:hypothetical protein
MLRKDKKKIKPSEEIATLQIHRNKNHASFAWLPSQKQPLCECLQPHHATVLVSAISVFNGAKPEPLCEPSQNGCDFDWPHAHHQYVPGSTFWTKGDFWAMTGSLMRSL